MSNFDTRPSSDFIKSVLATSLKAIPQSKNQCGGRTKLETRGYSVTELFHFVDRYHGFLRYVCILK